jgi:hypothetical protein
MRMTEPLTKLQVWRRFLLWALGLPLVVAGAAALVWAALWLSGGDLVWQAVSAMGDALFWLAAILLMYPALLWLWVMELREGLRAAAEWAALGEVERAARRAAPPRPARRKLARGRA